jgi:hypothetical protein
MKPKCRMRTKLFGQHVQRESANKLLCGNGHRALHVAVSIIPPAERDVVAIEREQTMVGDGDAMGITAEVTQNLLRAAKRWFDVDDPWMSV